MAAGRYDFPFTILDVASVLGLTIRRNMSSRVYADCPLPDCNPKRKGKMKLDTVYNSFHCYYCGETGGMLELYSKTHNGISYSDSYKQLCQALNTGQINPAVKQAGEYKIRKESPLVPQSEMADIQCINAAFSALFNQLTLSDFHRQKLRGRGLTDEQIDRLGYKSTPKARQCEKLTACINGQGHTVQGVPGFYLNDNGKWTVKFNDFTSGIIIPVRGIDGLIRGAQIRLDNPFKEKDASPSDEGTKYIWLSSCGKRMGVTSGSPVHFIGNPFAKTVYFTEGFLKADIAHCLMNRTFAASAGGNNIGGFAPLMALLAQNGTELAIEATDMDKFRNKHINKGASGICEMAIKNGLQSRRLTWNPNYKGIDDWQLALRTKNKKPKEVKKMTFKERFLYGMCDFHDIDDYIEKWLELPKENRNQTLCEYLGLTEAEYEANQKAEILEEILLEQRKQWRFCIYQLDFSEKSKTLPFAFEGIRKMRESGFEQPPAPEYRLIHEKTVHCPVTLSEYDVLEQIYMRYNIDFPKDYRGRSVSPSDVIELDDNEQRRYYYCDSVGFEQVKFLPALALPKQP
jgi:hypothetical protein